MPSHPQISIDLFDRYRAGECTPSEVALVRAALADDASLAALDRTLSNTPSATASPDDVRTDASWARFLDSERGATVRAAQSGAQSATAAPRRPLVLTAEHAPRASWPRRVAVLGAVAALGIAAFLTTTVGRSPSGPSAVSSAESPWGQVYATTTGERVVVMLRDGSRITLAPHSWLGVSRDFGHNRRIVALRGEALFDVAAAPDAPFQVRTGSVTTHVLGTTFDVRHYDNDRGVRVVVRTGRVRVTSSASSTRTERPTATLDARMMAFATDSSVTAPEATDAAQFGAWAEGQLVFLDAPLSDVLATLTRWYGYQFQLADSALVQTNLTMRVRVGSADDALATLARLLDAKVTMRDSTVWLSRQGSGHHRQSGRSVDVLVPRGPAEVGR